MPFGAGLSSPRRNPGAGMSFPARGSAATLYFNDKRGACINSASPRQHVVIFMKMSLVNYSSDEEEEEEEEEEEKKKEEQQQLGVSQLASSTSSSAQASGSLLATMQANFSSTLVETSLKLPDASQLFSSFDSVKESTVVNLSGGALSSKKRSDLNGSADAPLKKIPKGSLMPVRIVPDTAGGSLLPPQLRGRSNIATEDLDKLFTRKPKKSIESSPE